MNYTDKNGNKITEGTSLLFADETVKIVYDCVTYDGKPDLGINASNEDYMRNHNISEVHREFYPLSAFNLREVEIIEPIQAQVMKSTY